MMGGRRLITTWPNCFAIVRATSLRNTSPPALVERPIFTINGLGHSSAGKHLSSFDQHLHGKPIVKKRAVIPDGPAAAPRLEDRKHRRKLFRRKLFSSRSEGVPTTCSTTSRSKGSCGLLENLFVSLVNAALRCHLEPTLHLRRPVVRTTLRRAEPTSQLGPAFDVVLKPPCSPPSCSCGLLVTHLTGNHKLDPLSTARDVASSRILVEETF